MTLLGLQNSMQQITPRNNVSTVTPQRPVTEPSTQSDAPQQTPKTPRYDNYTPSQEGLDYVQTMSLEEAVASPEVAVEQDVDQNVAEDNQGSVEGVETPAVEEDVIDPTDYTNAETYDPSAWLEAYRNGTLNSTTTPETDSETTETPEVEEDVIDPTDYSNTQTYNPYAWLSEYRGVTTPEYGTSSSNTATVGTENSAQTTDLESSPEVSQEEIPGEVSQYPESSTSSRFDLQAFLTEADAVAKEVVSQLENSFSSYSDTENWLNLLQSSKVFS